MEELLKQLPAYAVLPATIVYAVLKFSSKFPQVIEALGIGTKDIDLQKELQIYKLRYEIAAIRQSHNLRSLGEEHLLQEALSRASFSAPRRLRFTFGLVGGLLAIAAIFMAYPDRADMLNFRLPGVAIIWMILLAFALGGALIATFLGPATAKPIAYMSIGAGTVAIAAAVTLVWVYISVSKSLQSLPTSK